ncbi:MAG: hypothetical protein P1V18_03485 [Candidatus Gracilibacteria bacterium]|nr:hypothetical protein [Candidatus Gracilibacteria bacterium]
MAGLSESLRFEDDKELNESMKKLMLQFKQEVASSPFQTVPPLPFGEDVEMATSMDGGELRAAVSLRHDDMMIQLITTKTNILALVKNVQRYIGQMELFVKGDVDQKRGLAALVATGDRYYDEFQRRPKVLFDFVKREKLDRAAAKKCYYVPQICAIMYSILDGKHSDDTIMKTYELGYFLLQETTTKEVESGARVPRKSEEMNDVEVWMSVLILRMTYEKMSTAHDVYARLDKEDNDMRRRLIREKARGRMHYDSQIAEPFHSLIATSKQGYVFQARDELMKILKTKAESGRIAPIPKSFKEAMAELTIVQDLKFQHLLTCFVDLILG